MERSEKLQILHVAAVLSGRDPERLEDYVRLLLKTLENPTLWPPEPSEGVPSSN
jgi:hypothetical protein